MSQKTAVVTGASGGIGAASARALAGEGYHVYLGARRIDLITELAEQINGTALPLDITDEQSVAEFAERIPAVNVLVNNAGGARNLDPIKDANVDDWRYMWELNVLGTLRVTKAFLPQLIESKDGLVITITSTAAIRTYPGGSGYTSSKFAQGALTRTLREELLGQPVRVTELAPGAVETDFSINRFNGDTERAANVYAGWTPLVADDVADIVRYVASLPSHVNIDQIIVQPRDQVAFDKVNKKS